MTVRPALSVAVVAALCALVPGVLYAGQRRPGNPDRAASDAVEAGLGDAHGVLTALVLPTEPPVVLAAVLVTMLVCAWRRRWAGAVLAVVAPAVAVAVNTWVLKPMVGRYYDDHLAYPSGHTVSLVSVLAVIALLATATWRRVVVGAGIVLTAAAGAGMIGLGYHYLTDVLGGAAFAVAATLAVATGLGALTRHGRRLGGVPRERREPADGT